MKKLFKLLLLLIALTLSYLGGIYTPDDWSVWLKAQLAKQTQQWTSKLAPIEAKLGDKTTPSKAKYRDLLVTTPDEPGPFGIMVNAYSDPAHGETLVNQLNKAGFQTQFIAVEDNQNLGWSLLIVGQFPNYSEAKRSADKIGLRFPLQTRIIHLPQPSA